MPTPTRAKPPIPAWIIRERKRLGLKPRDLADRLTAMSLPVTDGTVRTWEAGRNPHPDNVEGLERIFGSAAPGAEAVAGDQRALITAMTGALMAQTQALVDLRADVAEARRSAKSEREAMTKMLARLEARLAELQPPRDTASAAAVQESRHRERAGT